MLSGHKGFLLLHLHGKIRTLLKLYGQIIAREVAIFYKCIARGSQKILLAIRSKSCAR